MTRDNRSFHLPGGGPLPSVAGTDATASADAGTPVYDEFVAVLATGADTDVSADGQSPAAQSAVRRSADTVEGTAILALFSRPKDIEEGDGGWPGGDVVEQLCAWFAELGIDVDDDLAAAARTLRLPEQPLTP